MRRLFDWSVRLFVAVACAGCEASGAPSSPSGPGDGGVPDGWDARCPGGILVTEPKLLRSRTRYTYPAIARHRDGFLLANTRGAPAAECSDQMCAVAERLAESGEAAEWSRFAFAPKNTHARLFAGTDDNGDGHFAAMAIEPVSSRQGQTASRLHWGSASLGSVTPISLDTSRGTMTVAFGADEVSLITHGWRPEGTAGEGHQFPVSPRVETYARGAAAPRVSALDSTDGGYFADATLTRRGQALWMLTAGLFSGRSGVATSGWSGPLPTGSLAEQSRCSAVSEPSGSLLIACAAVRSLSLVRQFADGRSESSRIVERSDPTQVKPALVQTLDGSKIAVATMAADGVRVTVFDRALAVLGESTLPMRHTPSQAADGRTVPTGTALDLAVSDRSTFALVASPFPTNGAGTPEGDNVPVEIHRFRLCPAL